MAFAVGKCVGCSGPLPPAKPTGRPRRYCSEACRLRTRRRRRADIVAGVLVGGFSERPAVDLSAEDLLGHRAADPDEAVLQAIVEARTVAAAFGMVAQRARPELAWRCDKMAGHIADGLERLFKPRR